MKSKKLSFVILALAVITTISLALLSNRKIDSDTSVQGSPNRPVIYELGSNSCSSCVAMLEVMRKVEANHSDRINVVKIDVFKDETAQDKFNIRAIPTQVIKNSQGEEVFRHEGFISYDALIAKLDQLKLLKDRNELD